jgi:hypothetical protein
MRDAARTRHERLVQRYATVAGRVTALFTGSFAIEMIFTGLERWYVVLRGMSSRRRHEGAGAPRRRPRRRHLRR